MTYEQYYDLSFISIDLVDGAIISYPDPKETCALEPLPLLLRGFLKLLKSLPYSILQVFIQFPQELGRLWMQENAIAQEIISEKRDLKEDRGRRYWGEFS